MKHSFSTRILLLLLPVFSITSIAATPECAPSNKSIGSISQWLSGEQKEPLRDYKVAQDGAMSIYNSVSVFDGIAESSFNVYYGFSYAADLGTLLDDAEYIELYSLFGDLKAGKELLGRIKARLTEEEPELVAAMDKLWANPKAGKTQQFSFFGDPSTVEIIEHKTLENFPDSDGKTDVILVKMTQQDGSFDVSYFSTEYCMDVGFEYEFDNVKGKDELIGFISAEQRSLNATPPKTPQTLIERTNVTLNSLDFATLASLTNPAAMERLKILMVAAYQQNKVNELNNLGLSLGKKITLKEIEDLPAKQIYTRVMASIASNSIISRILMASEWQFLDTVTDEEGNVVAVVKVKSNLDGNINEVTDTMPISQNEKGQWLAEINRSVQQTVFRNIGVQID